jgi:hypothetical protein
MRRLASAMQAGKVVTLSCQRCDAVISFLQRPLLSF